MNPKNYEDKYSDSLELGSIFDNRLNDLKNEIKVQLPCEVVSVNYELNQVDLKILDYDTDELGNLQPYAIIPNVPIRHPIYSGLAYLILPVQVGDTGTIEFFDSSIKELITTGRYDYDYLEEWHSLDCGLFTNGFLPANKVFNTDYNSKIILATSNNIFIFKVNSNDELEVHAKKVAIASDTKIIGNLDVEGDINSTGTITGQTDVIAGGKSGKTHTHTDSEGGATSPPI